MHCRPSSKKVRLLPMSQKVLQAEQLASCAGHESMQSYAKTSGLLNAVFGFWASPSCACIL